MWKKLKNLALAGFEPWTRCTAVKQANHLGPSHTDSTSNASGQTASIFVTGQFDGRHWQ